MPYSNPTAKKSPAFASQLKKLLKTQEDRELYFQELTRLAKEHMAQDVAQKRKEKKWSQQRLAKEIGTTQAVISRIEQGRVDPGLGLLVRLKIALNVSLI